MKLRWQFFLVSILLHTDQVSASCLQEVKTFAVDICDEIEKSGTKTVVDANGKLDAQIGNIVSRVVGAGSADLSGKLLENSYKGVLQEQLSSQLFDIRACREKMVTFAAKEVCQNYKEKENIGGETAKVLKNEFSARIGQSMYLTDDDVVFSYLGHPCGGRGDLICVVVDGKNVYLGIGSVAKFGYKGAFCSITLLQIASDSTSRFFLKCPGS